MVAIVVRQEVGRSPAESAGRACGTACGIRTQTPSFSRLATLLDRSAKERGTEPVPELHFTNTGPDDKLRREVMGVVESGYVVSLTRVQVQSALDRAFDEFVGFLVRVTKEEMVVSTELGAYNSAHAVSLGSADPEDSFEPLNAFGEGRRSVRGDTLVARVHSQAQDVYLYTPKGVEVTDGGQKVVPWKVALEAALGEVVH